MIDVIFLVSWNGYDDGARVTLPAIEAQRLIDARICVLDNAVPSQPTGPSSVSGGGKTVSADYTLAPADDNSQIICTQTLTLTVPAGLAWVSGVSVQPPASGIVTFAVSGTMINGAAASATRTRADNRVGVALVPYAAEANAYGLSGS